MSTTSAQNAQRIASELNTAGVRFDSNQIHTGVWFAELELFTAKKLIERYQKITGKQATVYNISGGIVLLWAPD